MMNTIHTAAHKPSVTEPTEESSKWIYVRMGITILLLLSLLAIVIWRAYQLQIAAGPKLQRLAQQQYMKEAELTPRRGTIYDRRETVMAVSVDVDSVYANPKQIGKKWRETAAIVAPIIEMPVDQLQALLRTPRYFVWLKRQISARDAAQLKQQIKHNGIQGIFITQEARRYYPNQQLGSSFMGFSNIDGHGLEGLELSYESLLRGNPIKIVSLRDALGRRVLTDGTTQNSDAKSTELVLTIDRYVQHVTEVALQDVYRNVHPERGWAGALVLNPQNGDILAMASVPHYDPNHFAQTRSDQRRNRVVADTFEPGSTMKVFSLAAAVQAGVVTESTQIDCENGQWRLGRHIIHDTKPYTTLSAAEILHKSSNIGMSKVALKLGKQPLYDMLKALGFGQRVPLKLPGVRSGILRSTSNWSQIGTANIAFGQGMTASILHLGQALSAIANDGIMTTPRLVLRTRRANHPLSSASQADEPVISKRVMSQATARTLRKMMTGVTQDGGTAEVADLKDYTTAGKTGTAQKVDPVTKTYGDNLWVSSFMGLTPADQPALAIVVVVNEPIGAVYHGGDIAGPIYKRIAEQALPYLGIKGDR